MIIRNRCPISSTYTVSQRFMTTISERQEEFLKNIIKPDKIPLGYWKKVLWVAKDLKESVRENEKKSLKLLETSHVTLLFVKPHGRFQLAFTLACDLLGARRTLYFDSNFENQPSAADSGRVLSKLTDMLITHGLHHDILIKLISQMTVPIFSASCNIHCLQKALSDLMTFQEKLDRLKGLTLAWIGPPNSLFNSYLLLSSLFGINIRYTCICSYGAGRMSPVHRFPSVSTPEGKQIAPREFKRVEETVAGAHIIATSMHPETKNRITAEVCSSSGFWSIFYLNALTASPNLFPFIPHASSDALLRSTANHTIRTLLKNADPNWVFIHSLPRTPTEVSDDVFNHQNNLSFETSENYLYIAMAIILTSLKTYEPKMNMPCYEEGKEGQFSS